MENRKLIITYKNICLSDTQHSYNRKYCMLQYSKYWFLHSDEKHLIEYLFLKLF